MKSEPWIDKVYQENSVPLPELNYAHWQQAEAMIINQEKEKRKKRIIFWLFISTFVVALVSGVFYFITKNGQSSSPIEQIENKELTTENALPSIAQMTPSEKLPGTAALIETERVDSLLNNAKKLNDKTTSTETIHTSVTQETNLNTKSKTNHKILSKQNQSVSSFSKIVLQKNANQELVDRISPNVVYQDDNEDVSLQNQYPKLSAHTLPKSIAWVQASSRTKAIHIYSELAMAAPIVVNKMTWREKGIRMALAQHIDPYSSNTAISYANAELFFQKQIRNNWFYGLSVGYKSHFNKTQYAQVITEYKYQGFSAAVNNFGIKPEWIQSLSVQINSGLDIKKNRLSIGLNPEMIFASKGVVNKLQFKDLNGVKLLQEANVNDVNSGWLNTQVLNKLSFSGFLAYDVKINKRFSLGLQFNKILYSPYKPLSGDFVQKNISNWNSGFRMSYIIK